MQNKLYKLPHLPVAVFNDGFEVLSFIYFVNELMLKLENFPNNLRSSK